MVVNGMVALFPQGYAHKPYQKQRYGAGKEINSTKLNGQPA